MLLKSTIAVACLSLSLAMAPSVAMTTGTDPELAKTKVEWTPMVLRPTVSPQVVQGSDGKYNLVYEVVLTNTNKHPAELTEIVVLDAENGKEIQRVTGKDALTKFVTTAVPGISTKIAPGAMGIYWVNLEFENPSNVPKKLTHKVAFNTKSMFDGKPVSYSYQGGAVEVSERKPVVISPPLRGGKWVAFGGYCGVVGHRRTLLPVDNKQTSAQRYAIDWCRLDDDNRSTFGDPYANTSCAAYAQPVYAVADGTVVTVVDKFDEQVPFLPKGTDRYSYPAGNCIVLDIGDGLYGMYAHLKPGSIKVKPGDKVKRGETLALLGNSGNSTGPHLHFHVVDSPSILGSNGVPYVFDKFNLIGEIGSLNGFFTNDAKAKPQTIADSKFKGPHQNQLVREGHIVEF
jgi:hypothetical protein